MYGLYPWKIKGQSFASALIVNLSLIFQTRPGAALLDLNLEGWPTFTFVVKKNKEWHKYSRLEVFIGFYVSRR